MFCNKILNRKPQCLTQYGHCISPTFRSVVHGCGKCHSIKCFQMWKECVRIFTVRTASTSWSKKNVPQYFATLPAHRWIKRVLAWELERHAPWARWPPKTLLGYYAQKLLSAEGPAFMATGCYGRRLLELYMIFVYGVRIAVVFLYPGTRNKRPNVACKGDR